VKVVGIPSERIVPYGESLGVGVALELARRRSVPALVAEAGFTSLADVGAHAYPLFPVRLLARYRYDNLSKIAELRCPLLLIHSPEDEIVPIEHAQRLLAAAHEPKRLLLTEADHNGDGFLRHAKWRREVGEFLNGVVPAAAGR